ncbi:MAG: CHAT domain-containing protein [Planctomycetota bacterium]|nr:MAG: CHAT domain-containing protein [Planctomycetota bacterium]
MRARRRRHLHAARIRGRREQRRTAVCSPRARGLRAPRRRRRARELAEPDPLGAATVRCDGQPVAGRRGRGRRALGTMNRAASAALLCACSSWPVGGALVAAREPALRRTQEPASRAADAAPSAAEWTNAYGDASSGDPARVARALRAAAALIARTREPADGPPLEVLQFACALALLPDPAATAARPARLEWVARVAAQGLAELRALAADARDGVAVTPESLAALAVYGALADHELALAECASGDLAAAARRFEEALARWTEAGDWRHLLHWDLVDTLRVDERWRAAERAAGEARAALATGSPGREIELRAALVETRLELDLGRLELAARHFARANALASADDLATQLEFGALLLASDQEDPCIERMDALAARLALDARAGSVDAEVDAQLALRRGIALAAGAARDPARRARAAADIERALPRLAGEQRLVALAARGELALDAGDAAGAASCAADGLAALASATIAGPGAQARPQRTSRVLAAGGVHALRARVAVAAHAPDAELAAIEHALEASWRALLAAWDELPEREGGLGFLQYGARRRILVELCALRLARRGSADTEASLALVLDAQVRGMLARALHAPPPTAGEARALLSPGQMLLVFVAGPRRSLVWCIDAQRTTCEPVAGRDELRPALEAYAALLATPPALDEDTAARRARLRASGARVAAKLIPERARTAIAAGRALALTGLDTFGSVPFEALPDAAGVALGARCAIQRWPSLPVALALSRRAAPPAPHAAVRIELLAWAAPRIDAAAPLTRELPLIPFAASDWQHLSRPWPKSRKRLWSGAEATEDALATSALAAAGILHLQVHGVADSARLRPRALALAPGAHEDGLLWADEIERLQAPPLVVLASCAAAHGPARRGDDAVQHLVGAWLRAGARCVVASEHALDHYATLELCARAYERIAKGAGTAEALRDARAQLAAAERWSDPFYWGLVQVHGLGARRTP